MSEPFRIGWFSTGRGPGSRALLSAAMAAIRSGELPAEIALVFCNRERGQDPQTDQFLDLAEGYGLRVITLSDRAFRKQVGGEVARAGQPLPAWRGDYDRAMLSAIAPYSFDVAMLAGYMLILWPETTTRHPFLNLHPAAPGGPKGTWQNVIWQLIREGAHESGVYLHVATPELDEGPVATYCRYSIRGEPFDPLWQMVAGRTVEELQHAEGEEHPLFTTVRAHGAARELPLVIRTLAALADRRIRIEPGRVLDAEGNPAAPLDLSEEVDARLEAKS
jgi:folate-dependent phosphoribosylglycinamide formyltransferase PurN